MLQMPISHSVGVLQSRHRPNPEPLQSSGILSYDGVRYNGSPPPLTELLEVPAHEDVVSGDKSQIDVSKR